jgi:hypothetical protein
MSPTRIEDTLLVVQGFRDASGFEWRAGDRAPIVHKAVRQAALAHPDLFLLEFAPEPVDVGWLREVDATHEAAYRTEMRRRDEAAAAHERALRDEMRDQDLPQPELERRFKKQEQEREEREQEWRKELERRQIEEQLASSRRPRSGFNA